MAVVSLDAIDRGSVQLTLTSPSGMTSQLLTRRSADKSKLGFQDWPFMSVHFWGELPAGIWTLTFENHLDSYDSVTPGAKLRSWSLVMYGTHDNNTETRDTTSAHPLLEEELEKVFREETWRREPFKIPVATPQQANCVNSSSCRKELVEDILADVVDASQKQAVTESQSWTRDPPVQQADVSSFLSLRNVKEPFTNSALRLSRREMKTLLTRLKYLNPEKKNVATSRQTVFDGMVDERLDASHRLYEQRKLQVLELAKQLCANEKCPSSFNNRESRNKPHTFEDKVQKKESKFGGGIGNLPWKGSLKIKSSVNSKSYRNKLRDLSKTYY